MPLPLRLTALLSALAGLVPAAAHPEPPSAPTLRWHECADARGFECARAGVPRDYAKRCRQRMPFEPPG
jgi:hypothetical protein